VPVDHALLCSAVPARKLAREAYCHGVICVLQGMKLDGEGKGGGERRGACTSCLLMAT